jgi:hypothetical protein
MRFALRVVVYVSGVALAAGPALGHVAPAQTTNGRYIKVLPFADRVRVAYTVFYGEVPGRALRVGLDADHDGLISDAEAHAYGAKLAAQVAAAVEVQTGDDGAWHHVTWAEISVGLGTPVADAGAWSVDLIAWPCSAAGADGVHHVRLRDRYDLPLAGETELWVVDAPDITVKRATLGEMHDEAHDYQWSGPARELATDGLDVEYVAGPRAGVGSAGACGAAGAHIDDTGAGGRVVVVAAGAAGALIGLGAMLWARRKKPRPAAG